MVADFPRDIMEVVMLCHGEVEVISKLVDPGFP